MKIAILLNMPDKYVKSLKEQLPDHDVRKLNPKDPKSKQELELVQVIIGSTVPNELLVHANQLRLFQVPWVGVDKVNFEELRKKKIPICNSKWNNRIVAEYALTLLLALMKQIIPVHNSFSTGSWQMRSIQSRQLTGSSVLLIGFGSIGQEIAKLLQPFTTDIYALRNNPKKSSTDEQKLVKEIIGWDNYSFVVKKCDVVIVSLPLTPKTEGILDKDKFKIMNPSTLFINVGRGKTVVENDLFEALKNKTIAGAGLDVWYNYKRPSDPEPFFPSKFPFQELDNVIMSPHRSATFSDTPDTIWEDTVYNIKALESSKPLRNVIDINRRY